MDALSDADYVSIILRRHAEAHAEVRAQEIASRLETDELQLQPKSTVLDKIWTTVLFVLLLGALVFVVAFVAGLAVRLLAWAW